MNTYFCKIGARTYTFKSDNHLVALSLCLSAVKQTKYTAPVVLSVNISDERMRYASPAQCIACLEPWLEEQINASAKTFGF